MKLKALLAISSLALCSAAHAEITYFIDVGAGQSKLDVDAIAGVTIDNTGATFNLNAGAMFTPNFGFEVGLQELGEATLNAAGSITGTLYGVPFDATGTLSAKARSNGYTAGLIASVPVGQSVTVSARAGFYQWETKASAVASGTLIYDGTTYAGDVEARGKYDGTDPYYGLAIYYNFNNYLGLGASYTRFTLDFVGYEAKVDSYDLRLKYSF
jgi:hypothetical protein